MANRHSLIASIGLLALLSGCGGGGGGGSPTPSPAPADTTPDAITFTNQTGTAPSTTVASNQVTVTGINAAAAISITGGEYSIGGGAFTSAPGTVSNNQTVTVRVNSSGQFSTQSSATLTIGGVSAVFTVTTVAADTTPDAFVFTPGSLTDRSVLVSSNSVTITGLNTGAPISIANGEYSINGGAYTSTAGTVTNNQQVMVRLTTSSQFSTPTTATLSVGGVAGAFSVTTIAEDTTPDAFAFQNATNQVVASLVTSNSVTINGINNTTPVSIQNGEFSVAGGAYRNTPGTIEPGQALTVRTRASTVYTKTSRATVTVGGVSAEFAVTAEATNYTPDDVDYDGGIVYLLSSANRVVFRWSVADARYLEPYELSQPVPALMAYSAAHQRVYLASSNGAIRYFSSIAANPAETTLVTLSAGVTSLSSAGNFLAVQLGQYSYGMGRVLDSSGAITASQGGYYYGYSGETNWDPVTSRLYYTRDGISPNDLHYDVINQTTGQITTTGESPYHGDYNVGGVIRASANGQYVVLGSGNIFSQSGLNWSGSVASTFADARWFADGSLVSLTVDNNQTVLRRLSSNNLTTLEQLTFAGQALRIFGSDASMVILLVDNGTVQFRTYAPDDDSDDDGVVNTQDAFPLDRAASVDSDGDGYPDSWNAGRSQADSTTGLALDAFAQDSACWLTSHGAGGVCNYAATMPNYTPDKVEQSGDVIYLLSRTNRRVYRWSISGQRYLNPYVVPLNQGFTTIGPTTMALSAAQQRLYLGYTNGAIRYIDLTAGPSLVPFTTLATGVYSLSSAGNFLLAQASGGYGGGSVLNSNGAIVANGGYYYGYSRETAWDPITSRAYYFRDGISPNDLHYDVINQGTGQITSTGETPYHGGYNFGGVIRVTSNGQYVLTGAGDIFGQNDLNWSGTVGSSVTDARWMANGALVALTTASNQTQLRRLSGANLSPIEQRSFTGEALRVVGSDTAMVVVVLNDGTVQFHSYVPDDDSDDDGVDNAADAFPLDPAASVDTDRDGYPDAWNPGRSAADSTSVPPLTLDAFPDDSACWLSAHGSGGACDYGATMPDYIPDHVVQQGDIVYLLSSVNRRVYRWSISTERYLNPYVVGISQGFTTVAPTEMAYVANHGSGRLYLGYAAGTIRYLDPGATSPVEVAFVTVTGGLSNLTGAGNYLAAQNGNYYSSNGTVVLNSAGVTTAQGGQYYNSADTAWDPVNARLYYVINYSSSPLYYEVINQSTGAISSTGQSPYNSNSTSQPPARVSVNGQYIVLGNGDIYAQNTLAWAGSLGTAIADARWFADGSLGTLATSGNQTILRRLGSSNLSVLEQRTFAGQAMRVVGSDTLMSVLVNNNGNVQFHRYEPDNDSDDDGVLNTQDAFPLDVAASVDTDGDGYPDEWNDGRSQADSTSTPPLTLDAFPDEAACWLSAHGNGGVCNYGATVPTYTPDKIEQRGDVVYLLSSANRRVYRWSISAGAYLSPYVVGNNQGYGTLAPTTMAYSTGQQRLYLGYSTGLIRYLDVNAANPAEVALTTMPAGVSTLANGGNYLLVQTAPYYYGSGYVLDSSGTVVDQGGYYYGYSRETTWDPVNSRVYYMRDGISPNDLHYDVINQATGEITSTGETPYHGSYSITPPIRVSVNGQYVLLGSGDIYGQNGLNWAGSLGAQIADARWFADGSLVTLATSSSQTVLRRLGASNLAVLEQLPFTGQALRVLGSDTQMVVVLLNNGSVQFQSYVPDDDSDDDGVDNPVDAFPLDVAASVDTDGDGYPDAWNAGRSQADSTSVPPLTLDAFSSDSACWLSAHGSNGLCNYGATIPNYVPDMIASNGDIIYLLSSANRRVYRWSMATGAYLNPYVVGINQGFSTLAPTEMAYSSAHQRLYLGYSTGAIRYIDVGGGGTTEVQFANIAMAVNGLASVGNYMLAQDYSGAWATHYVLDSAGAITDWEEWNHGSPDYAWDPNTSRVYWFSMWSPSDLNYEVIDQATGQITGEGETPYHGDYPIIPPIRVSPSGHQVLLGSGNLYAQNGLTIAGSLGKQITDAHWLDDILVDVDTTDRVEIRDANTRAVLHSIQYTGQPLRVMFGQTEAYLVHVLNGTTAFIRLPFYDQDVDGLPRWWELLYGLSDTNAGDATADPDGDGVSNLDEYTNRSNPGVVDTDSDGLNDFQEIVTYGTNPARADSDGDGLNDQAEVITHQTDPWDTDSDNDGYTDLDEVLYGGNPNDSGVVPPPMTSFTQNFENSPNLAAWTQAPQSMAPWALNSDTTHAGTASLKSGAIGNSQFSAVRLRGVFATGTLSFWARVDAESCCDRLYVLINGVQVLGVSSNSAWTQYSVPVTAGIREIEWRYQKDSYAASGADAAWIDDVSFAGQ